MNIRKKTLLILGFSLVGLVVLACLIFADILLGGFTELELRHIVGHMDAAEKVIQSRLSDLAATARSAGSREEVLEAAVTDDPAFVRDTLDETLFLELRLNALVIMNDRGRIVWARGFDLKTGRSVPPDPVLLRELTTPECPLVATAAPEADSCSLNAGLVPGSGGPMMAVARPILGRGGGGPPRGTVVFARYLDRSELDALSTPLGVTLDISAGDGSLLQQYQAAKPIDSTGLTDFSVSAMRFEAREGSFVGYRLLTDLRGRPDLILRATLDRSIFHEGKSTTTNLLVAFLGLALSFDLAVLFLSETWVISRLFRLSNQLKRAGSTGNTKTRIAIVGNDEVTGVARAINGLLDSLDESREDLLKAQRELETRVEERTAELAAVNKSLRVEMAEKMQAREDLQEAHDLLEVRVARRTAELMENNLHLSRQIAERRKAEAALRESEQRYRVLFDSLLSAFSVNEIITDESGKPVDYRLLDANPAFDKVCGYKREDVIGKTVKEVVPDFEDFWIERFGEVALKHRAAHFDGYSASFGKHFEVAAISQGEGLFVLTFSDVTERKRAEREREATIELLGFLNRIVNTEDLLNVLARFLKEWMGCDAVGIRLREGDDFPYVESLGFGPEFTLREHRLGDPIPGGESGRLLAHRCVCGKVLSGARGFSGEHFTSYGSFWSNDIGGLVAGFTAEERRYCPLSACQVHRSMVLVPLRTGAETLGLLQFNSFSKDVFGLEKIQTVERFAINIALSLAQRRAEEQQRLLTSAVEQAAEAIVITDTEGRIQYVNPAFEKITGYSREEIIGANPRVLNSGKHDPDFYWNMWQTLTSGHVWVGRLINRRKDGSLFEEEATISPVRDDSRRIVRFVAVKRDVTQEVELEKRLRVAQKMESLGTLAGGIAHDFNNILAAIIGYTELSRYNAANPERVSSNLDQVLKAATRAKDLVQQILAFSRQQEGERLRVEVGPVVKEVLKLIRASVPATVEIRKRILDTPVHTVAEAIQIHQVLMNLCTNAAHAMRRRGGILDVELDRVRRDDSNAEVYPDLQDGEYVRLVVRDTGHGMDAETLDRIFDPYFTTKEKGVGTGLGLSVVHGIIKSHGGTVLARSAPEVGTEFEVLLPLSEAIPVNDTDGRVVPFKGSGRILLVDDEPSLIRLGSDMLSSLGYSVITAGNGMRALEILKTDSGGFDLLVTDMTMPGMTGLDLAREARALFPRLVVLLCTGYSDILTPEAARDAGILQVIAKPFTFQEFSAAVGQVLSVAAPVLMA